MTLSAMAPRPFLNTLVTSPERRNATTMRASQQSSSCAVGSTNSSWPTVQMLTQSGTPSRTGAGSKAPQSLGSSRKISVLPVESWLSKLILGMLRSRRAIEAANRQASNKLPPLHSTVASTLRHQHWAPSLSDNSRRSAEHPDNIAVRWLVSTAAQSSPPRPSNSGLQALGHSTEHTILPRPGCSKLGWLISSFKATHTRVLSNCTETLPFAEGIEQRLKLAVRYCMRERPSKR